MEPLKNDKETCICLARSEDRARPLWRRSNDFYAYAVKMLPDQTLYIGEGVPTPMLMLQIGSTSFLPL